MHAYLNEYIIRHHVRIHPLFYRMFEYTLDHTLSPPKEYVQQRVRSILSSSCH